MAGDDAYYYAWGSYGGTLFCCEREAPNVLEIIVRGSGFSDTLEFRWGAGASMEYLSNISSTTTDLDAYIWGNGATDSITGSPQNNYALHKEFLHGNDGNDSIHGQGGTDLIDGGPGNDTIMGGGDGDFLFGDDGNDIITGGAGDDEIEGGDDVDRISAGPGNDWIDGGKNQDFICGDAGTDILIDGDSSSDNDELWDIDLDSSFSCEPGGNTDIKDTFDPSAPDADEDCKARLSEAPEECP